MFQRGTKEPIPSSPQSSCFIHKAWKKVTNNFGQWLLLEFLLVSLYKVDP